MAVHHLRQRRAAREDPAQRRALILAAAQRCLASRGMRGFTLRNIAAEAGVSVSLLSHYFGSMEQLGEAVFSTILVGGGKTDDDGAAPEGASAEARLRQLVRRNFGPQHHARRNLKVWLPIYEELLLNPQLRRALARIERSTAAEVARRIAAVAQFRGLVVDCHGLAQDFLAYRDGLWIRGSVSGRRSRDGEADAALRLLEAALGPLKKT